MDKNKYYRSIPKTDQILENPQIISLINKYNKQSVLSSIRNKTEDLRTNIKTEEDEEKVALRINNLINEITRDVEKLLSFNLKRVVNGTGTILHTNLGRAVISDKIAERIKNIVTGYSNLEYDIEKGERGSRYSNFEETITKITGAQAAVVVNNNAGAVLLILSALAKDKEVIISRGELIEIGGSFRIPDVMIQSGAKLIEVGTTNKTHLFDYENAITSETAALLKVHTSNYKILGFTESVSLTDLNQMKLKHNIPIIEDLGSGVLVDLRRFGLSYERTVQESIKEGADIVCFSGDKLLGGPQAGIIIGKKEYIEKIKKHPLTRALRIDKFTAIALESIFHEYLDEEKAITNLPVLNMIKKQDLEIKQEATNLYIKLVDRIKNCELFLAPCYSQIGGGSLPLEKISSYCLKIRPHLMSVNDLEKKIRTSNNPIIGRIEDDYLLIDFRTILQGEEEIIYNTIIELFS